MNRLISVVIVASLAAFCLALSSYLKVFQTTYNIKAGSKLAQAACTTCHLGKMGGKLNPYGMDVQKQLTTTTAPKLTTEMLKKIESLDSDKDGKSNIEEIKADRLPGVTGK